MRKPLNVYSSSNLLGLTKATKVEETPAAKCHFPPTRRRGGCPAQHNVAMGPPESRARFSGRRKDTFLKGKPCPSFVCGTLAFCRQTKQASSRPVLHEVSGIGTHSHLPTRAQRESRRLTTAAVDVYALSCLRRPATLCGTAPRYHAELRVKHTRDTTSRRPHASCERHGRHENTEKGA